MLELTVILDVSRTFTTFYKAMLTKATVLLQTIRSAIAPLVEPRIAINEGWVK